MNYSPLLMFPCLFTAILLGIPVAFSMLAIAFIFGAIAFGEGVFFQFVSKIDELASSYILAAVPLFIFMGAMLERSGLAERLFRGIEIWTRKIPGGLALATIIMCVLFAASAGVVGATEVVVGILAIPAMNSRNYHKGLIAGSICAGGSLGTIIPPSIVAVVLAPLANVSVGDLYFGAAVPGVMLAVFFMLYVLIRCLLKPQDGPAALSVADNLTFLSKVRITLTSLVPAIALIVAVLGSILGGLASPTEAAALGALGAALLTIIYHTFSWAALHNALLQTLQVTSMIMFIILAGSWFTGIFFATGGMRLTQELLQVLDIGPWLMLSLLLALGFIGGVFLDWLSLSLILIPLSVPLVLSAGFDVRWFCILFMLVIQTSYLTPPMAPAIFYFRGISPPEFTLPIIFRGVVPFVVIELALLALVMIFPHLALWLPDRVMK